MPEPPLRLTVLYDGDCRLCTRVAGRLAGMDRGRHLRLVPLQQADADRPEVAALAVGTDLAAALHVVDAEGGWASGGQAVLRVMERIPALRTLAHVARTPLLDPLVEPAYRFVAERRHWFGWLAGDFAPRREPRQRPRVGP